MAEALDEALDEAFSQTGTSLSDMCQLVNMYGVPGMRHEESERPNPPTRALADTVFPTECLLYQTIAGRNTIVLGKGAFTRTELVVVGSSSLRHLCHSSC